MRDPNESGELTAESRAAAGTAATVKMVDPQGNLCDVSLRHQKDGGTSVVDEKLAAGWTFPAEPAAVDAQVDA